MLVLVGTLRLQPTSINDGPVFPVLEVSFPSSRCRSRWKTIAFFALV